MQGGRHLLALICAVLTGVAAPAMAAECKLGVVAELPVTMDGASPQVKVKLNEVETPIVVDSGAFFSVLGPELVAKLGLRRTATGWRVSGVGGSTAMEVVTVKTFQFAGLKVSNVDFITGNQRGFGHVDDGLLGQNILRAFEVEYDLGAGMIRLLRASGDCKNANLAYWSPAPSVFTIEPTTPLKPHLMSTVMVNGVKFRAIFDTGAAGSVLSRGAAAKLGVRPTSEVAQGGREVYGIGPGVNQSWIAPFDSVEIGGETIKATKLRIASIGDSDADMLVGADFFLSHRIVVSTAMNRVYFTYGGGPVFRLESRPPPSGATATRASGAGAAASAQGAVMDASAYSRRGLAFMARRDFASAVADFSKAVELEPTQSDHHRNLARAHLASNRPVLAMADLAEALARNPDDMDALMVRGMVYLKSGDDRRAREDFEHAIRVAPDDNDPRLAIAEAYSDGEHYDQAMGAFGAWIAAHPKHAGMAAALNGRCWLRARLGRELEQALADCEAAVKLSRSMAIVDSRGLVRLKLGQHDAAIADYDAVLKQQPKAAWTLYARGVAKQRKGLKAEGDADIAAATSIDPKVVEQAKRAGLDEAAAKTVAVGPG